MATISQMLLIWGDQACIIGHWLLDSVSFLWLCVIHTAQYPTLTKGRSKSITLGIAITFHLANTPPQALRKLFYQVIVENKTHGLGEETHFDFKYIPNYSTITELGEYAPSGIKEESIEKRNLRTLIVFSAVLGILSYVGMRTTWGIVGGLRSWWRV